MRHFQAGELWLPHLFCSRSCWTLCAGWHGHTCTGAKQQEAPCQRLQALCTALHLGTVGLLEEGWSAWHWLLKGAHSGAGMLILTGREGFMLVALCTARTLGLLKDFPQENLLASFCPPAWVSLRVPCCPSCRGCPSPWVQSGINSAEVLEDTSTLP